MGFFDRAKAALGFGASKEEGTGSERRKGGRERPPRKDLPPASPSAAIEDALGAREAGRAEEGRAILQAIDRGKGLRTVLRAAAAHEAGDDEELASLLAPIAASESGWRLALQIACAALARPSAGVDPGTLVAYARGHGAPGWALAWAQAASPDPATSLAGKVDLLFADAALARTLAAREWGVPGAADEPAGVERFASFAHGRDAIRRFGADPVAAVFARAFGVAMAGQVAEGGNRG